MFFACTYMYHIHICNVHIHANTCNKDMKHNNDLLRGFSPIFFLQFNLPEIFGNSKQLFMNGTNYSYPQFLFIFGFFKMFRGFLHNRKNCKSGIQNYDLV